MWYMVFVPFFVILSQGIVKDLPVLRGGAGIARREKRVRNENE